MSDFSHFFHKLTSKCGHRQPPRVQEKRSAPCRHRAPPDGLSKAKASVKRADWNWCCYRSFRLHVSRNDRYQERLKRAEAAREDFLREYHIANVRKHVPRNVIASLWWLERRYPNQFALRNVYRSEGSTDQPIGDKIDESQLRRFQERE